MKKFLILTLATLLSLGVVSAARAGTVAVDIWSGGEFELEDYSFDLSQVSIGVDVPVDQFKFAASTSGGSFEIGSYDFDTSCIILKGGYALIDNDQIRLDLTGGFYNRQIEWNALISDYYIKSESFYSVFIGLDSKIIFAKTAWLDFNYCYGVNPQTDFEVPSYYYSESEDIDSISILNIKLNYLFTNEFGASLGYRSEKIGITDSVDFIFSGLTIGAFYKF